MKRNSSLLTIVLQIGIIFVFILGIYLFLHKGKQGAQENTVGNKTQQAAETKKSKQTAGLRSGTQKIQRKPAGIGKCQKSACRCKANSSTSQSQAEHEAA